MAVRLIDTDIAAIEAEPEALQPAAVDAKEWAWEQCETSELPSANEDPPHSAQSTLRELVAL